MSTIRFPRVVAPLLAAFAAPELRSALQAHLPALPAAGGPTSRGVSATARAAAQPQGARA